MKEHASIMKEPNFVFGPEINIKLQKLNFVDAIIDHSLRQKKCYWGDGQMNGFARATEIPISFVIWFS